MHKENYYHPLDHFPYQPISRFWMIMYILLSIAFFIKLNRMTRSNNPEKKDRKTNWLRENILLSFIHASICSIWIIISVLRAPEIFEDPLSHSNDFNYALIAFSLGYFIYDFIDCILNSTSSVFAILIHHIMVITFFTNVLYHTRILGYTIYGLSVEINSVFLHARRLLRWYAPITRSSYYNNQIKIWIEIGNYLTFILFRFGIIFFAVRALHTQRNRLHPIVYLFSVIVGVIIGMLNIVLFYRLTKKQFFGKEKRKQEKENEDQISMTNNFILLSS